MSTHRLPITKELEILEYCRAHPATSHRDGARDCGVSRYAFARVRLAGKPTTKPRNPSRLARITLPRIVIVGMFRRGLDCLDIARVYDVATEDVERILRPSFISISSNDAAKLLRCISCGGRAAWPCWSCLLKDHVAARRRREGGEKAEDELPTLHDVRRLGKWDTGGATAVEFVRAIRMATLDSFAP